MKKTEKMIYQAERHCKSHGVSLTVKRKLVLSGLIESEKALSAYELIDFCKEHYNENVPAMSVYRILEFLEQEHLVHKLHLANKYVACAHILCDHDHGLPQFLICNQCSTVKEIHIKQSTIDDLHSTVKDAGFALLSQQLEMNCLCKACSADVML